MGNLTILEQIIDNKIMDLHTAYLAKVISFNETVADIQPLMATKTFDGKTEPYAIISNVPVIVSARSKGENSVLEAGDIVLVVCCERGITEAIRGKISTSENAAPYSMSDSIIIGVL